MLVCLSIYPSIYMFIYYVLRWLHSINVTTKPKKKLFKRIKYRTKKLFKRIRYKQRECDTFFHLKQKNHSLKLRFQTSELDIIDKTEMTCWFFDIFWARLAKTGEIYFLSYFYYLVDKRGEVYDRSNMLLYIICFIEDIFWSSVWTHT